MLSSIFTSIVKPSFSVGSLHNGGAFGFLYPRLHQAPKFTITLPEFIGEWILKAVPKKKPSYRRTRQKLYAPGNKKIQPLNNIVRCPACGSVKRSHFMCMNCFMEIKQFLKTLKPKSSEPVQADLDEIDTNILYPQKRLSAYGRRMKKRDWIPQREKPLMFDSQQVKHRK
ncbi:hypothetical protein CANTEDRAFT_116577 [Yamadazyma tenuis ATCC 10573]|uniref:Large ribosomal subunit protein bL32m n=2 Tax=Candida tenuis TaxID=2315449 RepID=G3BEC2_CANTC|nr:uncharacterized protein CANTEDRAFT_116577 [Yamadazyma tenuis ATCC 10573]EGV60512.1 hypothetical protein CANTEDRAFT_116577 [Yamadazyma tenuis ATCC 10573]